MATIQQDILDGLSSSVAVKGPVAVVALTEIALSGERNIDGVQTAQSRVLVVAQADARNNGIWVTDAGPWRRAKDFSRNDDVVRGSSVRCIGGFGAGTWVLMTAGQVELGVTPLTFALDLVRGADWDAAADDVAGLAAFDGEAAYFSVLVSDAGDGRAAIYTKKSATPGDWTDPAYVTGMRGPKGNDWVGAWATATEYFPFQIVRESGSSYICLLNHTSDVFATDLAGGNWELFAQKGDTGAQGIQGEQGIQGPIGLTGPTGATGPKGDKGNKGDKGDTGNTGATGSTGATGDNGWTPVEALVADGARYVRQVIDWTGGNGTKPATGKYVGASGFVDDIGDAVDVRGPAGPGSSDMSGPSGAVADNIVLFDGTSGKAAKDSGKSIADFATAAQGGKADTAVQPGDLGTAAAKNTGTSAGNVPVLDGSGLLDENVLPALAITDTFEVADQAAMLALTAQRGDVAVRSDLNKSFILKATPASTLANWVELRTPTDAVLSVAGKTGAVTLANTDISGLGGAAILNVGTSAGTVAAGDDSRFGTVPDAYVTNAKLANMAQATIKGRAAGAGTGAPGDLSASDVKTIIGDASTSASGLVELATAAEYRTGTDADRALNVKETWDSAAYVNLGATLTGNLTLDLATFINGYGTASGNITFDAVSNAKNQSGLIEITASGGDRTVGFNTSVFCTPDNEAIDAIPSGKKVTFSYGRTQSGKIMLVRLGEVT